MEVARDTSNKDERGEKIGRRKDERGEGGEKCKENIKIAIEAIPTNQD